MDGAKDVKILGRVGLFVLLVMIFVVLYVKSFGEGNVVYIVLLCEFFDILCVLLVILDIIIVFVVYEGKNGWI